MSHAEIGYERIVQDGILARESLSEARWELGDLTILAQAMIGSRGATAEYAAAIGMGSVARLRQMARVSAAYAPDTRGWDLPWSIYRLVAHREDRLELLERAADEQMSESQVKRLIAGEPIQVEKHACPDPSCRRVHIHGHGE